MRKIGVILCVIALLTGCALQPAAEQSKDILTFTDDTGATVSVPREPKTVAVLTSSLPVLLSSPSSEVGGVVVR